VAARRSRARARGVCTPGHRLAACCDSRRQGNSRAQGLLVAKLAGGAAIVAALGADEGLQRHDEFTRRGKRERMGASSPRRRTVRRCARESDDGTVQGKKGREEGRTSSPRRRARRRPQRSAVVRLAAQRAHGVDGALRRRIDEIAATRARKTGRAARAGRFWSRRGREKCAEPFWGRETVLTGS
jgi:hypothetical protein